MIVNADAQFAKYNPNTVEIRVTNNGETKAYNYASTKEVEVFAGETTISLFYLGQTFYSKDVEFEVGSTIDGINLEEGAQYFGYYNFTGDLTATLDGLYYAGAEAATFNADTMSGDFHISATFENKAADATGAEYGIKVDEKLISVKADGKVYFDGDAVATLYDADAFKAEAERGLALGVTVRGNTVYFYVEGVVAYSFDSSILGTDSHNVGLYTAKGNVNIANASYTTTNINGYWMYGNVSFETNVAVTRSVTIGEHTLGLGSVIDLDEYISYGEDVTLEFVEANDGYEVKSIAIYENNVLAETVELVAESIYDPDSGDSIIVKKLNFAPKAGVDYKFALELVEKQAETSYVVGLMIKDSKGARVSGVTYQIKDTAGNVLLENYATGESAEGEVVSLPAGDYILAIAKQGAYTNGDEVEFTITSADEYTTKEISTELDAPQRVGNYENKFTEEYGYYTGSYSGSGADAKIGETAFVNANNIFNAKQGVAVVEGFIETRIDPAKVVEEGTGYSWWINVTAMLPGFSLTQLSNGQSISFKPGAEYLADSSGYRAKLVVGDQKIAMANEVTADSVNNVSIPTAKDGAVVTASLYTRLEIEGYTVRVWYGKDSTTLDYTPLRQVLPFSSS